MKISDYLRRAAINNTWTAMIAIVVCPIALVCRSTLGDAWSQFCLICFGVSLGWSLALWAAVWIAQVAEDNPESLDK